MTSCNEPVNQSEEVEALTERYEQSSSNLQVVSDEAVDEQWILAPIAVTIQRLSMKKPPPPRPKTETKWNFLSEALIPFMFAGFGLILAGNLLEKAEEWRFFQELPDAITLVPTLLGLKGNLEMTLASRLSTLANLGFMDSFDQKKNVILSNVALIQTQAIVVASIAVLPATLLGEKSFDMNDFICAMLSSVATASFVSFVLSLLLIGVVIMAKRFKINPDNITTPVAASLGDVSTLFILLGLGTLFAKMRVQYCWILATILIVLYIFAIVCAFLSSHDAFTLEVLKHGWWSVIAAMSITSVSGFVLKLAMQRYPPIAAFQPLVNGVGGNLVAIQASRISTHLHKTRKNKLAESMHLYEYLNPIRAFFNNDEDSMTARLLVFICIPGNLLFMSLIFWYGCGFENTVSFTTAFLMVCFTQVVLLLYICQFLVRVMWKLRIDPDSSAIPILTAIGDLAGCVLLTLSFYVLDKEFGNVEKR